VIRGKLVRAPLRRIARFCTQNSRTVEPTVKNSSSAHARGNVHSLLGPMLLIERSRLPEPWAFATFMNRKKAG
jgi:hypothetical protein